MKPAGRWLFLETLVWSGHDDLPQALTQWLERQDPPPDVFVVQDIQSPEGPLDPITVMAALGGRGCTARLGLFVRPEKGRSVSVTVRDLTALDHLVAGGAALLFGGDPADELSASLAVARAMQSGEMASAGWGREHIDEAPNLPPPLSRDGLPIGVLSTQGEEQAVLGPVLLQDGSDQELDARVLKVPTLFLD